MELVGPAIGGAAVLLGHGIVTATKLYVHKRKERLERRRLKGQWSEDTGRALALRAQTDRKTHDQLWQWMEEQRERAERIDRQLRDLRADYEALRRQHADCQRRTQKLEQHVSHLQQVLAEEYGRTVTPPSMPPTGQEES